MAIPIDQIRDSGIEDAEAIAELADVARRFIRHHKWCGGIIDAYFDRGIASVAVFKFRIEPLLGADDEVWIIVGDIPPAYMDTPDCPNGATALEAYVLNMQDWVDAVRAGSAIDHLIPVLTSETFHHLKPLPEVADLLVKRLDFIRANLLTLWEDELRKDRP